MTARLRFQPQGDWPVGQHYVVNLDAKQTVADTVVLAPFELEFDTAPFTVEARGAEFYQDPQDAKPEEGGVAVPLQPPGGCGQAGIGLRSRMFDGAGRVLPSPALSTQVNARKLDAWVHSAPLELPPNGGQVFLDVGKGISSVTRRAGQHGGAVAEGGSAGAVFA
jgi:hypothetical protein